MKYIAETLIGLALICNIIEHEMLWTEFRKLKEWVEVLHGIDFGKLSEAVAEWKAEERREK